MRALLRLAGVVETESSGELSIRGLGRAPRVDRIVLDVGDTGTAFRFLLPFFAAGEGISRWTGTARMGERPHEPLLQALEKQGASFLCEEKKRSLPFSLHAQGLPGGEVSIAADSSSQFLSGLLLSAPLARKALKVRRATKGLEVSMPYVAMTQATQSVFGVEGSLREECYETQGDYRSADFRVPGDASAAFWYLGALALLGGKIVMENLGRDAISKTLGGLDLGHELGFVTQWEGNRLHAIPGKAKPFDRDYSAIPDLVPMAAVLALFLEGESRIRGVAHLRGKESDRLHALAQELSRCGASIQEEEGGLRIHGGRRLCGVKLSSHADHRLAAAFWILGQRVPGIEIDDLACVSKSYPTFFDDFRNLFRDNRAR